MRMSHRAALIALLLPLAACSHQEAAAPAPRPAIATRVQISASTVADRYSGTVQARYASPLAFQTGGKIVERDVNLGETVKKGQLLMRLDDADARLNAEAANAAVAAARTQRDLASRELERARNLLAKQLVSQANFDSRQNAFDVAAARLDEANRRADLARNQLTYTRLKADHDGVITAIDADVGQVVTPGQPILGLARDGSREFVVDVPETRVDAVRHAQTVAIHLWALPEQVLTGHVRDIAADADPATRTFQVRISLNDDAPALHLGMSGTARFKSATAAEVASLPLTSLYHDGDKPAVWIIDPKSGAVHLQPVTVARYLTDSLEIATGLKPGEIVVTKGVQKLHAGEQVKPQFGEAG